MILYCDDAVIATHTLEEHTRVLQRFFTLCREHQLFLSGKKSRLFIRSCIFLGFAVGRGVVEPVLERVRALRDYPAPKDRHQLRRWLGAVQFYQRHFPGLAVAAAPLHALTGDKRPFVWTAAEETAFQKVRALLSDPMTLAQPDIRKPFEIYTDASIVGFGAVVVQAGRPLGFVSKAATRAQSAWPTAELELFAVRYTLEQFKHWLSGAPEITVFCDHKTLSHLTTVTASKRLLRHYAAICEFGVTIRYLEGKLNELPDLLSRNPQFVEHKVDGSAMNAAFREALELGHTRTQPILDAELEEGSEQADVTMLCSLADRDSVVTLEAMPLNALMDTGVTEGIEDVLVGPSPELEKLVVKGYETDSFTKGVVEYLKHGSGDAAAETVANGFYVHGDLLYQVGTAGQRDRLVVAPKSEAMKAIFALYHDENAHLGVKRLCGMLSERFFVPGLRQLAVRYVRSCDVCQREKSSNQPPPGDAHPHAVPREPWEQISIDFVTGLPRRGPQKFNAILVVVDKFSKRVRFIPCRKTINAEQTALLLIERVADPNGAFKGISSDRGSVFVSDVFRSIWERAGVMQSLATANHPESTGQAERYVRAVVEALRVTLRSSQEDWSEVLPLIAMSMNAAPHSVHGISPFEVDTGRSNGTFLDAAFPLVKPEADYRESRKILQKLAADAMEHARFLRGQAINKKRKVGVKFKPGELVLVSQVALLTPEERARHMPKLRSKRTGPFKIVRMQSRNAAVLELPKGLRSHNTINVRYLQHYRTDPEMRPPRDVEPPIFRADGGDFYQVETIIGHKEVAGQLLFTVRWVGYGPEHDMDLKPSDFFSDIHIRRYCEAVGMPIPAGTPVPA